MSNPTAEQFAHLLEHTRLVEARKLDEVFTKLGGRDVLLEEFIRRLIQLEYITNWQAERIREGHRHGYFYGNWKVLYLVGAGTFARVYRAAHVKTADVKAVKVLRKRYAEDELTRERFEREAKTVMKLRHPNIVPIHEVDTVRNQLYMVMDFIEGQNLRDFVRAHKQVKLSTALKIIRDVAAGLNYAYQMGISHRDMKLSNILLSSSGRACIVDFGLAGIDDESSRDNFQPRSVDYAGLEKNTNVSRDDKRSDIYFLGCMLYNMLTGRPPLFETRERMRRMSAERFRNVPPITNLAPDLPGRVVSLVNHLMELNPEKRTQSPAEALDQIDFVIDAIESGDVSSVDKVDADREASRFNAKLLRKNEGRDFTIMVIESNPKVQDLLREKLKKIGYRVLILSDPERALQRFELMEHGEKSPADCVVFGCAGLGRLGFEAFNDFAENRTTSEIPALLLLGEDQLDLLSSIKLKPHHASIPLPIKFPIIRKTLRQLLKIDLPQLAGSEASSPGDSDDDD
ncbi:MAG TPA: serine/threonine-protein kinase [Pirellulaceae bacterium]|nr:serine/threonine-protein kinase [Pirellulaceae bacterium]HMO91212.1 serine/threonine-protein kinase [Pirellulaceae bacterium]HMP70795.1 serine/threonine-protein kinase [Pirellulaceae bacterium]